MNKHNDISVGFSWRSADRTTKRSSWLRDLAIALTIALAASILGMIGDAYAQSRSIQISGNNRTVMVTVPIGKSEDVRTDTSFVDVTVGDPEVADVNPLTDHALSILGKKIGTTLVSVPITAHAALAAAQCKDPTNKYVQNNLRLLEESYRKGKAIQ
ncbi:MAG: pilus assembly protein N-terminal domain-containing protein [Pseudolabrys sp.]